MITTRPRPNVSMACRAASMLVAFESFTNRTPPISSTSSIACSRPRNAATAPRHRRRARRPPGARSPPPPARRPAGAARSAARRASARVGVSPPAPRSTIQPSATVTPASMRASRAKRTTLARPRRAIASARASSAFTTAQSLLGLAARRSAPSRRRTPRRRRGGRGDPALRFSSAAIHGWNVSAVSSWKLLTSTTWIVSGVDVGHLARQRRCRCCRRPARARRRPSRIRPVSAVVVDLPFVPVMATTRPRSHRDASSTSPMTGTPAARAAATAGCVRRHARAHARRDPHSVSSACGMRRRAPASTPSAAACPRPVERRRAGRSASRARRGRRAGARRPRRSRRRRPRPPACPRTVNSLIRPAACACPTHAPTQPAPSPDPPRCRSGCRAIPSPARTSPARSTRHDDVGRLGARRHVSHRRRRHARRHAPRRPSPAPARRPPSRGAPSPARAAARPHASCSAVGLLAQLEHLAEHRDAPRAAALGRHAPRACAAARAGSSCTSRRPA